MIKAGIIGATGYVGAELVRLLHTHGKVALGPVGSVSFEGKPMSEIYPNLLGICDAPLVKDTEVIAGSDVVFASVPHGVSEEFAAACMEQGKFFIDMGADFRLTDEEGYKTWYGGEYKNKVLHEEAVYCIPELHRERLKRKKLVGNPGCYPTSVALGLYPLLKNQLHTGGIIIDAASGTTGAGRGLAQNLHFADCNENFAAYKIAAHRHTPEIEETLSGAAGEKVTITFVPHLLPVNRGILSTMYVTLKNGTDFKSVKALYQEFYKNEPFVRVLPDGQTASVRNVKCSNYCDVSLHHDARTGRLIVISAIDNMVKGSAGQAIQNMNILLGIEETCGLTAAPLAF